MAKRKGKDISAAAASITLPQVRMPTTSAMTFAEGDWDLGVARDIALKQTLVAGAALDDTLDGKKIAMFAQDDRDVYRDRCCRAAGQAGHAVPAAQQGTIKVDAGTSIRDVGKALYAAAS